MDSAPVPYKQMIFVCTNARPSGQRISCGGDGRCGEEVLEKLKAFVKSNGLTDVARAAKSGCQEKCEIGPNVVLVPQNVMLSGVTLEDADRIIETYLRPLVKQ